MRKDYWGEYKRYKKCKWLARNSDKFGCTHPKHAERIRDYKYATPWQCALCMQWEKRKFSLRRLFNAGVCDV